MASAIHASAAETLERLRADRSWKAAFETARAAEEGARPEGWNDASLIDVYQECLVSGLTFDSDPDAFLEACRRVSRLLFRYGRSREASNYLLMLRDLSPDKGSIPPWAWAYTAKLAYQEDLDYCIRKPREVTEPIENAFSANCESAQSSAVLADFINTATRHLSEQTDGRLAEDLSSEIAQFVGGRSLPDKGRIEEALARLDELSDGVEVPGAEPDVLPERDRTEAREWQAKAEELGARLARATKAADQLEARSTELEKENQELRLQLQMLREQADQRSTSVDRLSDLILRLEDRLKALESDWKIAQQSTPVETPPEESVAPELPGEPLPGRSRIVVVGESRVAETQLAGICKSLGIVKDRVEFRLSYKAFDTLDINTLQYNDTIAGILIGPVPHKVPGMDDPAQALLTMEGFPPTVKIQNTSGVLKITKTSFREALRSLLTLIASVEPGGY